MSLQKIIIHEITKEQNIKKVDVFIADSCLETNNIIEEFELKLRPVFEKESSSHAIFSDEARFTFPKLFSEYLVSEKTNSDFWNFTEKSINDLAVRIESENFAKGGYLVFSEYQSPFTDFICIFLVRNIDAPALNKTEDGRNYDIRQITHLDTNKLAMACRINVKNHQNYNNADVSYNYLAFIGGKQQDVSSYFYKWLGVTTRTTNSQFSKMFRQEVINKIELPLNPETNQEMSREDFKQKSFEYINSQPQKVLNMFSFSEHFFNERNKVSEFLTQRNLHIDSEFKFAKPEMTKLKQIAVEDKSIKLKFSYTDWENQLVRIGQENPNQVIIESSILAEAIRKEIDEQIQ